MYRHRWVGLLTCGLDPDVELRLGRVRDAIAAEIGARAAQPCQRGGMSEKRSGGTQAANAADLLLHQHVSKRIAERVVLIAKDEGLGAKDG